MIIKNRFICKLCFKSRYIKTVITLDVRCGEGFK